MYVHFTTIKKKINTDVIEENMDEYIYNVVVGNGFLLPGLIRT